jgi:heme oxygenase
MVDRDQYEAPVAGCIALAQLRQATAGRHATIESLLRLRQAFGLAHYARVLRGFGAFLGAWEPAMAHALPARLHPWFTSGRRLVLLQQDLAALGLAQPAPAHGAVPALSGLPEALGSLYVLEGSALGGRFIAAHVRRHLALTPTHGAAYFHGCGAGTAARWREFQLLLAAELDGDAAGVQRAARAAQRTFDGLLATFEDVLHERQRVAA